MFGFKKENPKTILESLDRSFEILDDRYNQKLIPLEVYVKQCNEINLKREKYKKMLDKQNH